MDAKNLKLTTLRIYEELQRRNIRVEVYDASNSWLRYEHKGRWHFLRSTLSHKESAHSYLIAHNKALTLLFLKDLDVNLPMTIEYDEMVDTESLLARYHRLVVKPINGAHGYGITTTVRTAEQLNEAIKRGLTFSDKVLIQEYVEGKDYRMLIIDGVFVAAMQRTQAIVVGDGVHTIKECIETENQNPSRGNDSTYPLGAISIDRARECVDDLGEILPIGKTAIVSPVANLTSGGSARDVTDEVPDFLKEQAECIAKQLKMGICGVDFLWDGKESSTPYVIEVNATPGINMHDSERFGKPRGAVSAFVDYLLRD